MNENINLKALFGINLKIKRLAAKLTQEDLAEKINMDVRTVSRIEVGEFGTEFATIEKICEVLNVEPYELFLPIEETPNIGELLIETQKIYKKEIERLAKESGVDIGTTRVVQKNSNATNRFDRNRNKNINKLAPIRSSALANSFAYLIETFPDVDKGLIWSNLQNVHYQIAAGIAFPAKFADAFVSAHQSWVKTSGTAFETFIMNKLNEIGQGVMILKPKDFSNLSSKDEIINQNKLIGNREDDLLVVFTIESHYYLVGVIQAKTSVRERMKTDAAHSQLMLKSGLWSIHVTIDPDNFLRNPKFRKLADGTSELGRVWHGVYKLSSLVAESTGIFDFNKLGTHLEQAIQITLQNKMSQGWHPE